MSRRPSVFVLALTVGDYLLWNWSLNGNHDVLALVSGLTLPPLALVSLWVLALAAMRLSRRGRPPARAARVCRTGHARRATQRARAARPHGPPPPAPTRTRAGSQPDRGAHAMSARRKRLFSQRPGRRRRLLAIAGVLVLVLVGIGLGAYLYERNRTGSVYHPHAPFTPGIDADRSAETAA